MAGTNAPAMEELIARFRRWVADCPLDIAFNEGTDEAEIAAVTLKEEAICKNYLKRS